MFDVEGEGFIAGLFKGVRVRDGTDASYHTGGDTVFIDGETNPHALRGVGGEDLFGMAFGIFNYGNAWCGAPYTKKTAEDNMLGSGYEGVMYRIFGPDPIWFNTSITARFGTKASDIETILFAYVNRKPVPDVLTVPEWKLAAPFQCETKDDFERDEWLITP